MTAATGPAAGSKHTPGPWTVYTPKLSGATHGIDGGDGSAVVFFGSTDMEGIRRLEDARLIAAAPDQHDALCSAPVISKYHTAIGFDIEGFVRDYENWSEKKRAAIAKATGATP